MTDFLKILCPEAFFTPEYPQSFKFDLIIGSENFGGLEIRIDKDLELSELKGDKRALDKLEEIGKIQAGKAFYCIIPSTEKQFIKYPFKNALHLITALDFQQDFKETKEFNYFGDFISKVLYPIDTEILY